MKRRMPKLLGLQSQELRCCHRGTGPIRCGENTVSVTERKQTGVKILSCFFLGNGGPECLVRNRRHHRHCVLHAVFKFAGEKL